MNSPRRSDDGGARSPDQRFAIGVVRAGGGAVLFGLPLLMTMEMWWFGFAMSPGRLALLLVVAGPLLVGLSRVSGFERTDRLLHDVLDACVAYAVGFAVAAVLLLLLGVVTRNDAALEVVGKVSLQAVPASMGALLAQSQFGGHDPEADRRKDSAGYGGEIFLMAVGALVLSFNIAPTEEVALIAARLSPWQSIGVVVLSLAMVHAFVYALEFAGQSRVPPGTPFWSVFLRYSVAGYAVVLLMSAYVLWTFGRLDDTGGAERLARVVVLSLPGAVGGAAARLIL